MANWAERLVPDELRAVCRRAVPSTEVIRPPGAGADDGPVTARSWRRPASWRPRDAPGGSLRRCSARAGRPSTDASPHGAGPASKRDSTVSSSTSSEPTTSWTGRGARSTRPARGPQKGATVPDSSWRSTGCSPPPRAGRSRPTYQVPPPRRPPEAAADDGPPLGVSYRLTKQGAALEPALEAPGVGAEKHMLKATAAAELRRAFSARGQRGAAQCRPSYGPGARQAASGRRPDTAGPVQDRLGASRVLRGKRVGTVLTTPVSFDGTRLTCRRSA